jgi:uncharacterized protein (DUF4415 family)
MTYKRFHPGSQAEIGEAGKGIRGEVGALICGPRFPFPAEAVIGFTAEYWLNMQAHYDFEVVRRQSFLETEREITPGAAVRTDPDAQPLTPKQLKAMVPMRALRGRPKSENKKLPVSVRYSREVVVYFKSTGEGWQSRMDGVLREDVERRSRRM